MTHVTHFPTEHSRSMYIERSIGGVRHMRHMRHQHFSPPGCKASSKEAEHRQEITTCRRQGTAGCLSEPQPRHAQQAAGTANERENFILRGTRQISTLSRDSLTTGYLLSY